MDGVAAAASTGKAALYRRWPSKAELVADALDHALPAPEDAPDRGNIREDLIEHMRQKGLALQRSDSPGVRFPRAIRPLTDRPGSGSRPLPSRRPGLRALWRASAWEVVLRGL